MKSVHYYNVYIYNQEEKTNASLIKFIDEIQKIKDWKKKVRKINGKICSLFFLKEGIKNKDKSTRAVSFGVYRTNYKPFLGDLDNKNIEEIEREVVELLTLIYCEGTNSCLAEFNRTGLKIKDIENYLNSFLPKSLFPKFRIKFTPIIQMNSLLDIKETGRIKDFEIHINVKNNTVKTMTKENSKNSIVEVFKTVEEISDDVDSNIIKLSFGLNGSRTGSLNLDKIKQIIENLNLDNENLHKVLIQYQNNEKENWKPIDLKELGKQIKRTILENDPNKNPNYTYVGDKIKELYIITEDILIKNKLNSIGITYEFENEEYLEIKEEPDKSELVEFEKKEN